jgi:hypothetical protein
MDITREWRMLVSVATTRRVVSVLLRTASAVGDQIVLSVRDVEGQAIDICTVTPVGSIVLLDEDHARYCDPFFWQDVSMRCATPASSAKAATNFRFAVEEEDAMYREESDLVECLRYLAV